MVWGWGGGAYGSVKRKFSDALYSVHFRVTISGMNICDNLEPYRYGCFNIPGDFYCANDCRETDFTELSRFAPVSDSRAREKSGGCGG